MTADIFLLAPEIVLVAVAVLIYILGAFVISRRIWSWLALGGNNDAAKTRLIVRRPEHTGSFTTLIGSEDGPLNQPDAPAGPS